MSYTIKRVGTKSAAKVAFVCLFIVTLPMIPAFVTVFSGPYIGYGEPPPGFNVTGLIGVLVIPLLYGVVAALGAAILTLIYNLSVRFHGGIKLDIELQETLGEAKKKN